MDRRSILKSGAAAGIAAAAATLPSDRAANASVSDPSGTTFVFAHGSWHGGWCWTKVIHGLVAAGHGAIPLDLPGHGLNARFPESWLKRPPGPDFETEPSQQRDITLADYVQSIKNAVALAKNGGATRVVVVGHSMGGMPVTVAGEEAASEIDAIVYLTGVMPAPGETWIGPDGTAEKSGEQTDSLFGSVLIGNPAAHGALRWDPRSTDADYLAKAKAALAADVPDDILAAAMNLFTPDAPVSIYGVPNPATAWNYGALDRTYIKCMNDFVIRPATQQYLVDRMDAAYPDNPMDVHELDSSHEAMLAHPDAVAEVLIKVADRLR